MNSVHWFHHIKLTSSSHSPCMPLHLGPVCVCVCGTEAFLSPLTVPNDGLTHEKSLTRLIDIDWGWLIILELNDTHLTLADHFGRHVRHTPHAQTHTRCIAALTSAPWYYSRIWKAPQCTATGISVRDLPVRNGAVMSFIWRPLFAFAPGEVRNWDKSWWPIECQRA